MSASSASKKSRDAEAAYGKGELAKALSMYSSLIQSNEAGAPEFNNAGIIHAQMGQFEDALRLFRRAHRLEPDSVLVRGNLSDALWALGKPQRAVWVLRRAARLEPKNAMAHAHWAGRILELRKHKAAARRALVSISLGGPPEAYRVGAVALLEMRQEREAILLLAEGIDRHPRTCYLKAIRATALMRLKRYREAIESFQQALDCGEELADVWAGKAVAQAYMGRNEEALGDIVNAISASPETAVYHAQRASLAGRLGNLDEAIAAADAGLGHDSRCASCWLVHGAIRIEQRDFSGALESLETAGTLAPKSFEVLSQLALALHLVGNYRRSIKIARRALRVSRTAYPMWETIGKSRANLGHFRRAARSWSRYLRYAPLKADAWNDYAHCLYTTGRAHKARLAYSRASNLEPGNMLFRYNKAVALHAAGNSFEATNELREILDQHESFARARAALTALGKPRRSSWWDWWFRDTRGRRAVGIVALLGLAASILLSFFRVVPGDEERLVLNVGLGFSHYIVPVGALLLLLVLPAVQKATKSGIEIGPMQSEMKVEPLPLGVFEYGVARLGKDVEKLGIWHSK